MKGDDSFFKCLVLGQHEGLVREEGDELPLLLHGVFRADGLLVEIQDVDSVGVLLALRQGVVNNLFLFFQFGCHTFPPGYFSGFRSGPAILQACAGNRIFFTDFPIIAVVGRKCHRRLDFSSLFL